MIQTNISDTKCILIIFNVSIINYFCKGSFVNDMHMFHTIMTIKFKIIEKHWSDVFVRALTDHVLDFKFSVVRVNLFLIIYLIHFGLGDDHLILRGWGLKFFLMNLLVFAENKHFDLEDGGKIFYSPRFTRIHT